MTKTPATRAESMPMFEVVDQYDSFFRLGLTDPEKNDLIQHLLGPIDPYSNVAHEAQGAEDLRRFESFGGKL